MLKRKGRGMADPGFDQKKAHRWFAVEYNNLAMDLLEKPERSPTDAETMTHAAHAACLHWSEVGSAVNRVRALWLLAVVYAELQDGAASRAYASACLELAERQGSALADFDLPFAYEAMGRALAALGEREPAAAWKARARSAGAGISDPDDRDAFEKSLAARDWFGVE